MTGPRIYRRCQHQFAYSIGSQCRHSHGNAASQRRAHQVCPSYSEFIEPCPEPFRRSCHSVIEVSGLVRKATPQQVRGKDSANGTECWNNPPPRKRVRAQSVDKQYWWPRSSAQVAHSEAGNPGPALRRAGNDGRSDGRGGHLFCRAGNSQRHLGIPTLSISPLSLLCGEFSNSPFFFALSSQLSAISSHKAIPNLKADC